MAKRMSMASSCPYPLRISRLMYVTKPKFSDSYDPRTNRNPAGSARKGNIFTHMLGVRRDYPCIEIIHCDNSTGERHIPHPYRHGHSDWHSCVTVQV